jgi:hypothetical protein
MHVSPIYAEWNNLRQKLDRHRFGELGLAMGGDGADGDVCVSFQSGWRFRRVNLTQQH